MLVEHLLSTDTFSHEDIENLYYKQCSDCYGEVATIDVDTANEKELEHDSFICTQCDMTYGEEDADELDTEPREVFEWWIVSDYLERQLSYKGEVILKTDYGTWWGRQCTGQSIYMDNVIQEIFKGL
jgi:hypothetical protein